MKESVHRWQQKELSITVQIIPGLSKPFVMWHARWTSAKSVGFITQITLAKIQNIVVCKEKVKAER